MSEYIATTGEDTERRSMSRTLFFALTVLVSLPFLAATISLTVNFIDNPPGKIWQPRMLQSMLFNFGFWLGLCGTAFALTSTSEQRKTLGAAATLFGVANIVLGYALKRIFEQSIVQSLTLTPLIIPLILWFLAILIAVKAPGRQEPQAVTEDHETTGESQ